MLKEEFIPNLYDELIKVAKRGDVNLYLYPNRPDYIPLDNSDLIPKVIRWSKKGLKIGNFFELYPELTDRFYEELEKTK